MNSVTNIITIFQILTLLVAVSSGIYLIVKSSEKRPAKFIGLFLIAFTLDTIVTLLVNFEIVNGREYLYFLPINFWFLSAALLYIYTRELTLPLSQHHKLLHLIPGFTEFIALSVLFIFGLSGVLDMSNIETWYDGMAFYFEASVLYALGYYLLISWTIRKTRKSLGDEFSNVYGRELKWLETICYLSIFTMISWILVSYVESSELFNQLKFIVYVLNMFTIGYIIYSAFKQYSLGLDEGLHDSVGILNSEDQKVINEQIISDELNDQSAELFTKVKSSMEDEKAYLNPDLKIHDIAHLTNLSPRKLAMLINLGANTNFRGFVNAYRIEEAKELLESDRLKHLSMDGIAQESGFSSRTTFYITFKKLIGCSPKEYIDSRRN